MWLLVKKWDLVAFTKLKRYLVALELQEYRHNVEKLAKELREEHRLWRCMKRQVRGQKLVSGTEDSKLIRS